MDLDDFLPRVGVRRREDEQGGRQRGMNVGKSQFTVDDPAGGGVRLRLRQKRSSRFPNKFVAHSAETNGSEDPIAMDRREKWRATWRYVGSQDIRK